MILVKSGLFFSLSILFTIISLSFSLNAIKSGQEIRDLFSTSSTCFNAEANTWSASRLRAATIYTTCAGVGLVGGYGVLGIATAATNDYFYKTYTSLPTHTMIYYTLTIWAIDSWSYTGAGGGDDHFALMFDSTTVDGFRFSTFELYENLCGNSWSDLRSIRVFGRISHSATSLTLKLVHLLDQDSQDESFGFREVNLIFANTALSSTMCGRAPFLGFTNQCSCPEGQYDSGGSCVNCHANCASCFGGTASDCYQCRPGTSFISGACTNCTTGCAVCHGTTDTDCDACLAGYFLYNSSSCISTCNSPLVANTSGCFNTCSSPCTTITDYVLWDGSCSSTCDAPLQPGYINKYVKSCQHPCSTSSYLYWDGYCSSTCYAPLIQRINKNKLFCDFPCAVNEFAYWNGTCSTSCLPPLVQQTSNGRRFCKYPCNSTDFLYWNGTCISNCSTPLLQRIDDGDKFCDYSCQPYEFLYWDGSCGVDCPSPFTTRTEGTRIRNYCDFQGNSSVYLYWNGSYISKCDFPFTNTTYKGMKLCNTRCAPTEYMYWNGSCLSTCPAPLSSSNIAGILFCTFPCSNQNDYLYWDGSCSSTCNSPLDKQTQGTDMPRNFCTYRCLSTEFLFWNGTCGSTCPSPYVNKLDKGKKYCQFSCSYTEFLYYNGSCLENCPSPYIIKKQNGLGYCDYPCDSTQYLSWNGSCISSCPSPFRIINGPLIERRCDLPCSNPLDYYYLDTGVCSPNCDEKSRVEGEIYLRCLPPTPIKDPEGFLDLFLVSSAKPNAPSLIVLNHLTQYVRFLNTSLPARLEKVAFSRSRNIISLKIAAQMPSSLQGWLVKQPLPYMIEKNGYHSSFLVNYWGDMLFLLSSIAAAGLFQLLEKILRKTNYPGAQAAFEKLRMITMWNLCFVLLALNTDDIILFCSIDAMSLALQEPSAIVSLLVGMCFVLLALATVVGSLYIVIRFRLFRKEALKSQGDNDCTGFHSRWQRFYVLYRCSKETSRIKQLFYVLYILRMAVPQAVTVFFLEKPVLQAVTHLVVTVVILAFILIFSPLKKKINHIQLAMFEGATLVVNVAALILVTTPATIDGTLTTSHLRTFMGDAIILGSLYINLAIIVFLTLKLILAARDISMRIKNDPESHKTAWFELVAILLQQGAFGFEEMMDASQYGLKPEKEKIHSMKSSRVFPEITKETQSPMKEEIKETIEIENESPQPLMSEIEKPASLGLQKLMRFNKSKQDIKEVENDNTLQEEQKDQSNITQEDQFEREEKRERRGKDESPKNAARTLELESSSYNLSGLNLTAQDGRSPTNVGLLHQESVHFDFENASKMSIPENKNAIRLKNLRQKMKNN